jgi:hypothetical protein
MSVSQMSSGQMCIKQSSLGHMFFDQMSVGQMVFDVKMRNRQLTQEWHFKKSTISSKLGGALKLFGATTFALSVKS